MHAFTIGSCALLLGCGSTVFLDRAGDGAAMDAPAADAADAPVTDAPVADAGGCHVEPAAAPLCPTAAAPFADAAHPSYRVTHFQVTTPAALASPVITGTLNPTVRSGAFLWGVAFDLAGRRVRTGAMELVARGSTGQGLLDGRYRFVPGGEFASAEGALTVAGDRVTSAPLDGPVRLPFHAADGSTLAVFPLRCVRFVDVSVAGRCLGAALPAGGRFNECTSAWTATDRVEAVITVADARATRTFGGQTLCEAFAGSACDADPSTWPRPPDASCAGDAGFAFAVSIAAVAARIE